MLQEAEFGEGQVWVNGRASSHSESTRDWSRLSLGRAQCRVCIEPLLWSDFISYIPLNSLQIHGTLRSPRPRGSEKTKRPSLSYKWLSSLPVMGPKSEASPLISLSSPLCPSTPDLSDHLLNSKSMCFVPASVNTLPGYVIS